MAMQSTRLNAEVRLDQDFLNLRHALLDAAAMMDRIERGDGANAITTEERWKQIREAVASLGTTKHNRAETLQMIFSEAYDSGWQG